VTTISAYKTAYLAQVLPEGAKRVWKVQLQWLQTSEPLQTPTQDCGQTSRQVFYS